MKELRIGKPFTAILFAFVLVMYCTSPAIATSGNGSYFIEYQGRAAGLVSADEDLFAHFPDLIPGDVVTGDVTITNQDSFEQEIFFYTKPTEKSGSEKADELLDLLTLKIVSENTGNVIYEGDIHAHELNEPISLGVFGRGEGDTLRFTVSVPVSLGNEYRGLGNKVYWVFATEEIIPGNGGAQFDKTGDDTTLAPLFVFGCICVLISSLLFIFMKNQKAKEDEGR